MYLSSGKEMAKLDKLAVANGLEVRQMMELAGWHMLEVFRILHITRTGRVVIVVGKGNKGGDGLSAARHLSNHNFKVSVVLAQSPKSLEGRHQLALVKKIKDIRLIRYSREGQIARDTIKKAQVIIDALIGYRLEGSPRGASRDLVEQINSSRAPVVSYDVPTGVDTTSGQCLEPCIKADATLTLALVKKGLLKASGKKKTGKLFVADLGIPDFLYNRIKKNSRPDFKGQGLIKV